MTSHPGIIERRDRSGRVRYTVRVRRAGAAQTATFGTLAEALSWRAQALAAVDGTRERPERPKPSGTLSAPRRTAPTVEEAARRFCRGMLDGTIRTRDGRTFKPSTARNYEGALRRHVQPHVGGFPVSSFRRGDVQRLVDAIAAESSPEHARHALAALSGALRVAERYGELDGNPCVGVTVPARTDIREAARFLTDAEAVRLAAAAEADDLERGRSLAASLVALLLGSGIRIGEARALVWGADGLDLDAGFVRVRRSMDRALAVDGAYPVTEPKSRKSRRDVPLPPADVARLKLHRLASGRRDGALVFVTASGRPLSADGLARTTWERLMTGAKLADPAPTIHDLRHTFASHALAAGLSIHAVADLLGHSDAALVLRRYGHALPDEIAGAGRALEAWRGRR